MKKLLLAFFTLALIVCSMVVSISAEESCAHENFTVAYEDFTKNGEKNCGSCDYTETLSPIISFNGYSYHTDENNVPMLACSYVVDKDALAMYSESTGKTLKYGVVYANAEYLDGKAPLVSDTALPIEETSKIIVLDAQEYQTVDGIVRYKNSAYYYKDLYMCLYVYDGTKTVYVGLNGCADMPEIVAYHTVQLDKTFANTDKYLYRIGNGNAVSLGSLFKTVKGEASKLNITVDTITADGSVTYTYTENSTDWALGSIKFDGTGVVKLTASSVGSNTVELYLEVVDADNVTAAQSSYNKSIVLLNDVQIGTGSVVVYENCTVYGNGFTFNVSDGLNTYNAGSHGIITLTNATMDNLVVIGDVYDKYGAYTSSEEDYTSAVCATNSIIQNCYIANCSAPVRSKGNNTIINTTLYGGTIANMIIEAGVNTLTDVTTVNYNDGREVVGFGILISSEANETVKLVLNGTLKQYNFLAQSDADLVSDENAKTVFNAMFDSEYSAYHFTQDGKTFANPAIVSMVSTFDASDITDNTNAGYKGTTVTLTSGIITAQGYLYSITADGNTVDNGYVKENDTHISTCQGSYLPTFDFDLGEQEIQKVDDNSERHIYYDGNKVYALYTKGESAISLDITKLATVYKYNGIYYSVTASLLDENGDQVSSSNGTVTLENAGAYTLTFTVSDSENYDANGNLTEAIERTYSVELILSVMEPTIPNATISLKDANGTYYQSTWDKILKNAYLQFNLSDVISVTDNGETVDISAGTAEVSYASGNAFNGDTTITVSYTDGRTLVVVLAACSHSSPGSDKTITVSGGVVKTAGAINYSNAAGGTWTVKSVSFTGTNGQTVTNTEGATVTFAK